MRTKDALPIIKKIFKYVIMLIMAYVLSFLILFEFFSGPVIGSNRDLIGPKLRFDNNYENIGKAYKYKGDKLYLYKIYYRPLCWMWIELNELNS